MMQRDEMNEKSLFELCLNKQHKAGCLVQNRAAGLNRQNIKTQSFSGFCVDIMDKNARLLPCIGYLSN